MFYFTGIIIAFFLAILLFGKKNKTAADKILAGWLFFIGLHLLFYYLNFSGNIYDLPFLLGPELPLPLVHGPFLYLYTAALCHPRPLPPRRWILHFIPALLCYGYLLRFYFLPAAQKIWVYQHQGAGYEPFLFVRSLAITASGIAYVVWSGRLLRKHEKNIHQLFSYEEKINLRWLKGLIAGVSVIWLVIFTESDQLVFGAAVLLVLFIGLFGIRQVGIFTNVPALGPPADINDRNLKTVNPEVETLSGSELGDDESSAAALPSSSLDPDKRKYQKSGLTEVSAGNLHRQLLYLMESQQVFRESELSLSDLAERLQTHPNYLSQVINEKEGKNFFDYINTLRIAEFLKLAADPKSRRFTILALALDCGFNSKSSFIRYFKKVTGEAPSRYLQMQE